LLAIAAVLLVLLIAFFMKNQNKTVYGISEGTYAVSPQDMCSPQIYFDLQEFEFVLSADPALSYLSVGTFELDERIVATTADGKYTYIFEVVDNNTIRFVQKGSSVISSPLRGDTVADGTEFKFCGE
jgi:hypothetical protein